MSSVKPFWTHGNPRDIDVMEFDALKTMKQWDKISALKNLLDEKVKLYAWKGEQFYKKLEKAQNDSNWIQVQMKLCGEGKKITKQQMLHMNEIYKYWKKDSL